MLALKRYRALVSANLLALTAAIAGTVLLAPQFGAQGAAVATVAADATLAIACFAVLARSPVLRFDLAIVPKCALSLIAGLIPALVLSLHPLVVFVLSSVAYFAVAHVLGAIPTEVVQAFRRRRSGAASSA